MTKRWHYMGDMNLEYGGVFFNFDDLKHGYCEAVEVTDLSSAIGWNEVSMIESKSVMGFDDPERLARALETCGATLLPNGDINDNGSPIKKRTLAWRACAAYALMSYGYCDTDRSENVALGKGARDSFDSWRLNKRLRANASLRNYVRREFLR